MGQSTDERTLHSARIEIQGIIQGVGFRPFIYRLAKECNLFGSVQNTVSGVLIKAEAQDADLDRFLEALPRQAPTAAHISSLRVSERQPVHGSHATEFTIHTSKQTGIRTAQVAPDMDICPECLAELFDPADRRYLYPFINCTNCGPRYTLIKDLPYDRPATSMAAFRFCESCHQEYLNPENRRFHAQPNCCAQCGPALRFVDSSGTAVTGDPLVLARQALTRGAIVAIKGIGGFHLAVDAANHGAVQKLRSRKNRPHKPLAVMAESLPLLKDFATVERHEEKLLTGPQKPIVLLQMNADWPLSKAVAPGQKLVGAMLPYSPLHHLLFFEASYSCLVMTSGNMAGEPIIIDNDQALTRLAAVADYFLLHNRDIQTCNDDSVVRSLDGAPLFLRRSRSYAPAPLELEFDSGHTLAVGASLKNTICLSKGRHYYLSQHIGDLTHLASLNHFETVIDHLSRLLEISPTLVVHDLHPDYGSSRYAQACGLPLVAVQHHHAHAVSCMAENGQSGPLLAITLDGAGLGDDGTIWGGEILLAETGGYTRLARLRPFPLPGGDLAAVHPWRAAVGCLYTIFGPAVHSLDLDLCKEHENELPTLAALIDQQINAPLTSSCGRLFDCVAALTGIRQSSSFEGQAAMELEMAISQDSHSTYPFEILGQGCLEMNWAPMIQAVVKEVIRGESPGKISSRFHTSLTTMLTRACLQLRDETGLDKVALSGGVFQNATLKTGLTTTLEGHGFRVYNHRQVPPNDGGLALGQVVAGRAKRRLEE